MSFGYEFVCNPDPISKGETPISPHLQPQTSSLDQLHCFGCGDPLKKVKVVNGVIASGVDMVLQKEFVGFALQVMEIHPLMLLIRTLSMNLQTFSPTLHNPTMSHTCVNYVGTILTMVMIVHHGSRLSMNMNRAIIKTLYSIDHQEDLNQQRISDVHDIWDKLNESHNELLNMMQSFGEMAIQKKQAGNIDQSPPQEMSIQDMEDLKQQQLDEMKNMINQIQIEDYRNERIDIHYIRECEIKIDELKENFNGISIEINKKKELRHLEQVANLSTYTSKPSRRFNSFCYDDDDYEESTIPLNEIISQDPPSIAITPVLLNMELKDFLIMGDEDLSTILEKE
uniref:Uncharacterized protein n=1 Tax=Tanacetum cinerariifolium TaxID=118510 RepID=A0A699GL01_TANCI|nr:hypothetical protein [Tanacetum cinerariifolium]